MISRRQFLISSAIAAGSWPLRSYAWLPKTVSTLAELTPAIAPEDFASFVNPFLGTAGHGHMYPGATVPFGAVQLSPDTGNLNWDECSGYHQNTNEPDSQILGFSHTHLSGTGCGDMLDVLITPGLGAGVPGKFQFSHGEEFAEPGFYKVTSKNGIRVELTATERAGFHRYTFPKKAVVSIAVDLDHHFGDGSVEVDGGSLLVMGNDGLMGGRTVHAWADGRQIYFALKTSKPFMAANFASGSKRKINLQFHVEAGESVLLKLGISAVDVNGAQLNLNTEIPDWNFNRVRSAAREAWNRELSRIQVQTNDLAQKQIFYTALYHTMLAPTLFDDVDGRYRGMDHQIHQLQPGEHNYSTFSLWDTFRALHPLFTIMHPERVPNFVNTLIRMSQESRAGLPVWPLQGIETGCMTGYHSVSVIAEAAVKGFPGLNLDAAYSKMHQRAFEDDYQGLDSYRELGYVAANQESESASKTLEYCYNDWAISRVARILGNDSDAEILENRSRNFKNLFDSSTNFIRARNSDGRWVTPFNPLEIGHKPNERDYTEANAWQTSFGILHDPAGLIEAFGGREIFIEKLDLLFNQSSALPPDMPPDITGMVGQYAHGNEPCHHVAYLYNYAGQPYKTQARVSELLRDMYQAKLDGLPGNEDCGQMSAWYIMSAMGFYAVDPASGNYVFGSPIFDRVEIAIPDGKALIFEAVRKTINDIYIQSITMNGKAYTKTWFSHGDVMDGARFVFQMGATPNPAYGSSVDDAPPSIPPLHLLVSR